MRLREAVDGEREVIVRDDSVACIRADAVIGQRRKQMLEQHTAISNNWAFEVREPPSDAMAGVRTALATARQTTKTWYVFTRRSNVLDGGLRSWWVAIARPAAEDDVTATLETGSIDCFAPCQGFEDAAAPAQYFIACIAATSRLYAEGALSAKIVCCPMGGYFRAASAGVLAEALTPLLPVNLTVTAVGEDPPENCQGSVLSVNFSLSDTSHLTWYACCSLVAERTDHFERRDSESEGRTPSQLLSGYTRGIVIDGGRTEPCGDSLSVRILRAVFASAAEYHTRECWRTLTNAEPLEIVPLNRNGPAAYVVVSGYTDFAASTSTAPTTTCATPCDTPKLAPASTTDWSIRSRR